MRRYWRIPCAEKLRNFASRILCWTESCTTPWTRAPSQRTWTPNSTISTWCRIIYRNPRKIPLWYSSRGLKAAISEEPSRCIQIFIWPIFRYEYEYNLILKPDYQTNGNIQWFYFMISNTRKNQEYRINIINMMKPDSLYNAGMKPLMYSMKQAKHKCKLKDKIL